MIIWACVGSSLCLFGAAWSCCFIACAGSIAEPAGYASKRSPWGIGKHQLGGPSAYMLFLAQWARKLSFGAGDSTVVFAAPGTRSASRSSMSCSGGSSTGNWGPIVAIGVDEIQYGDEQANT